MADSFDAYRYTSYLRSRWRFVAVSAATAVVLAGAVSLVMPKQYTATARIVIDPPAGLDLRATVAVSPIYLESLRTYEQFASGDTLFQRAVEKLGLRSGPLESQKRRVLKVGLLRNTRILEVSATLPDPRKAQALAQFIAEATIETSRSLTSEGDADLAQGIVQQQQDLRQRLDAMNSEWAEAAAREPVQALQAQAENAAKLRAALDQQVANTELEIADTSYAGDAAKQQASGKTRLEQLRRQIQTLDKEAAERERLIATRLSRRERMESERKALLAQLTAVETQLREARGGVAYRGERLKLIEPGIVPERPSSPNTPLNVVAALLLGLALPILWLTLRIGYDQQRFRAYARARNE